MSKSTPGQKILDAIAKSLKKRDEKIAELEEIAADNAGGGNALRLQVDHVRVKGAVEIKKFPDVQKVAGAVEISNFPKEQSVHVLNLKDIKVSVDFPPVQKVEITNGEKNLKAEHWLPGVMARIGVNQTSYLMKALKTVLGDGVMVNLANDHKPIPVIITDGEGRILKSAGGPAYGGIPMGGGSRSGANVPSRINSGRLSIPVKNTPTQLITTSTPCSSITITALASNSGIMYVGGSNTSAVSGSETGAILSPLGMLTIPISDVSKVYVDTDTNSSVVTYTYQT